MTMGFAKFFCRRLGLRSLDIHAARQPPIFRRSRRFISSATRPSGAFWTSSRVVLFAAFTGSLTYLYGFHDARKNRADLPQSLSKPRYANKNDLEKAIQELRGLLGEEAISTDDEDLHLHGYSEWSSINIDQLPVAVAYPNSTEEVSQIARVCHKYRVPMIPYSGGSSLEANFSAPYGGMSVDFAHMDKVLALHEEDMDVVLQPSVQWMSLNDEIKHSGLFFPVDPGPSAKIGGMVGTSCSGTNAVRYGTMKDWVINLTVVLADGTVIKTRRRPRKSSAGYNLTNLFVGSEGTLGFVTEITLKLAVIPQETSVAVVTFPSIRDAAAAASKIMRAGVPVGAMEVMDEVQMQVINKSGYTKKKWKEVPTMFFKLVVSERRLSRQALTETQIFRHQSRSPREHFCRESYCSQTQKWGLRIRHRSGRAENAVVGSERGSLEYVGAEARRRRCLVNGCRRPALAATGHH
jgi:D-lactate dehydrogenase (cytochrome)